jgi:hypothetical protein
MVIEAHREIINKGLRVGLSIFVDLEEQQFVWFDANPVN